jgi:hypothetical protein
MGEKFEVTTTIDMSELWEAVWGSDGAGIIYWCEMIRDANKGSIDLWVNNEAGELVGNPQDFMLQSYDESDGEVTWHSITLRQLADAYGKALSAGETHCGESLSMADADACFGDIVLQYACFGEMLYG